MEVVAKAVVVWAEAGRAVAAMGPEAKEEEDKGGRLNRLLAARLDAFEPRSGGGEGHGGRPVRNKPRKSRRTLERPARVLGRQFACFGSSAFHIHSILLQHAAGARQRRVAAHHRNKIVHRVTPAPPEVGVWLAPLSI